MLLRVISPSLQLLVLILGERVLLCRWPFDDGSRGDCVTVMRRVCPWILWGVSSVLSGDPPFPLAVLSLGCDRVVVRPLVFVLHVSGRALDRFTF